MSNNPHKKKRNFVRVDDRSENVSIKDLDSEEVERKEKRFKPLDNRSSGSYPSQNKFNNSSKETKPEKTEEEKKLQELVVYYEKILQSLKGGLPKEDTDIFITNVLSESQGYEVKLSMHKFSSHCIELLLSISKDPEVSVQFMTAFAKEKIEVCTNANASHVTELLLNIAVQRIQDWSAVLEQEEESEEKKNMLFFISWITDFGEFIVEHFDSCLQDQYACHVACSVIRALGGDMSQATDFMSKQSINHKKEFRNQYMGEDSSNDKQYMVPVVLEAVPKFFKKVLKNLAKSLLKIDNIIDYVVESSSATPIQTLLCILKTRAPKRCKKLILGLSPTMFEEKNSEGIPQAFLHKNCSFVVEKLFQSADEEVQQHLWNEFFVESLEALITHQVGNYIIQRLFDVVESKSHFELMSEKTGDYFEKILSSHRYGIFIAIAGACNRLKTQQAQFMKNIMRCLQCAEPEDRQLHLVPLIMSFQIFDQPKTHICLQGSLLVQALIKFQKPTKIVNSILNMKTQDIANLACHMQGCHVLTAFFSSTSIGEKSKDKLIQLFKPNMTALACERDGSHTLSRIWIILSLKQRSAIAQMIAKDEKTLLADKNGSILFKKFGIFHFVRNNEKWKEIQNNLHSSNPIEKYK